MFLQDTYNFTVGYTNIKVEGYFVERFINLCMSRNIKIWDIDRKYDGVIVLKIKSTDLDRINEIAAVTRSNVTILKSTGVPHIIKLYKKRKIFVLFFIFVIAIIYLASLRIWQIEITGMTTIPYEELENEFLNEDVKLGMKKEDLDFDKIKNNIYMRRKDILWIGFEITGVKMNIKVLERDHLEEDELKGRPCNIIADKDGIIERINVRGGVRQKNVGDIVYKGDLLVSGVVSSEYSEDRYVHSNAEIKIKTWYEEKVAMPYKKTLVAKSGNYEKKYKLKIGNNLINLSNNSTKFEKYDTISDVKKLVIFNRFETPIELFETTFEEYLADEIEYTKEDATEKAKEEALMLLNQSIPVDAEKIDTKYKIFYSNDEVIVRVTTECVENAGIKVGLEG